MKIVFLDIDGVLNNVASLMEAVHLLPEKALLVRDLCRRTDASIVVSSAWAVLYPQPELFNMLMRVGIPHSRLIGCVREQGSVERGEAVQKWVEEHNPESYVIIDDSQFEMNEEQAKHFVHADQQAGLIRENVIDAERILNGA